MFFRGRLCFLLLSIAFSDAATAYRVKRASSAAPQTLNIPLRLDSDLVYSVVVNMSSSSPQSFRFALSTATAITTVAGSSCASCNGVPSYNPGDSTSVQQISGAPAQNVSMFGFSASGPVMREDCGLLQTNGSAWLYPNQTVTVANQSSAATSFRGGVSGMFGIGPSPFEQSPAAHWLHNNPNQQVFQVGIALNPPSQANSSEDGGMLHWIAPDENAYEGDVMWLPLDGAETPVSAGTNATSWSVPLDGWDAASAKFNISQTGTPLPAYLDPFYPNIVWPQTAARAIYADIPRSAPLSFGLTSYTNAWSIPCNTKYTLSVTFGTFTTSLDQASLVVPLANGICIGALQEWTDATILDYLLGAPFIASIYLILSYTQSGSGSMGFASRSYPSSNKLSQGAIAGVALGTIAVLALLLIAGVMLFNALRKYHMTKNTPSALWLSQRKQQHKKRKLSDIITPFPATPPPPGSSSGDGFGLGAGSQYARYPDNRLGVPHAQGSPNSPRAALLDLNASPDWQTTLITVESAETTRDPRYLSYQTDIEAAATAFQPYPFQQQRPPQQPAAFYQNPNPSRGLRSAHSSSSLLPGSPIPSSRLDPFDSPPPYMVNRAGATAPVPLLPLRKNRKMS